MSDRWHAPLARQLSNGRIAVANSVSRQLKPVAKAWYSLPFCWLLLWLIGILVILLLSFTIFAIIPGICSVPSAFWTGFVLRVSGVEKDGGTPRAADGSSPRGGDGAEGKTMAGEAPPQVWGGAALLFWCVFGMLGNSSGYIGAVLAAEGVVSDDYGGGLRSVGPVCAGYFILLHGTMVAAGWLGVFSIQRLPRTLEHTSTVAMGVGAIFLNLVSLHFNCSVVSQTLLLLLPAATVAATFVGCPREQHDEWRRSLATVVGASSVATAVLVKCEGQFGGSGGLGGFVGLVAVWVAALFKTRLALLQKRCGLSMLQCIYSLSRDQMLLALVLMAGSELWQIFSHRPTSNWGHLGDEEELVAQISTHEKPRAAICAMVVAAMTMHISALYPISARDRRVVEQVRIAATIIAATWVVGDHGCADGPLHLAPLPHIEGTSEIALSEQMVTGSAASFAITVIGHVATVVAMAAAVVFAALPLDDETSNGRDIG